MAATCSTCGDPMYRKPPMDTENVRTDMDNAAILDGLVDERAQADFEDGLYNENRDLREKLRMADGHAERLGEAIAKLECRIATLEQAAREEADFQDWRTGEGRA